MKKPRKGRFTPTARNLEGNCPYDGSPYKREAGLHRCPKCGHMRPLEYERNPYYGTLERSEPRVDIGHGTRRLPTSDDE